MVEEIDEIPLSCKRSDRHVYKENAEPDGNEEKWLKIFLNGEIHKEKTDKPHDDMTYGQIHKTCFKQY
jgi:hypothetical protein